MKINKKTSNVVFDKNMKSAKTMIDAWFKHGGIKPKRLDLILSKLELNPEGKLFISNNEHCDGSFYYSIDGKKFNDIFLINPRRICVRTNEEEILYDYVVDPNAEYGFRMRKMRVHRKITSGVVSCDSDSLFYSDSILVSNNVNSVSFVVSYSNGLSQLGVTELNNHKELEKYLMSLTFPCSILDVYKKICEISVDDLSQYSSVSLSFCKVINGKKVETDMISLAYGELFELKITTLEEGKVINMYQDGTFSYTLADETISFTMKETKGDKISCTVTSDADKKIDDYIESLVSYDITSDREEIATTKKLVREMFPKNKR